MLNARNKFLFRALFLGGFALSNLFDRDAYIRYAKSFSIREANLVVEFEEWLPDVIIDCHAHCNLDIHVNSIDNRAYNHMLSTFPYFSLNESKEWHSMLHPGKTIKSLRFPKTFRGINHKLANLYLLEESFVADRVAVYGLPDDIDYTVGILGHPRVSALKMYYSYLEPPATNIYQYFPTEILEVAQYLDIPIILHPPRKITMCLDQILKLGKDFPKLRVTLAHLSLTKSVVPGLEEAFCEIAKMPNFRFDTALVPSSDVVLMALKVVGPDKIMYGSDEPLNLIRSTPFFHPEKGERLITEYLYHWVDSEDYINYRHLANGVTHAHWQALSAIKSAISFLPEWDRDLVKKKIFFDNAACFYGFS